MQQNKHLEHFIKCLVRHIENEWAINYSSKYMHNEGIEQYREEHVEYRLDDIAEQLVSVTRHNKLEDMMSHTHNISICVSGPCEMERYDTHTTDGPNI